SVMLLLSIMLTFTPPSDYDGINLHISLYSSPRNVIFITHAKLNLLLPKGLLLHRFFGLQLLNHHYYRIAVNDSKLTVLYLHLLLYLQLRYLLLVLYLNFFFYHINLYLLLIIEHF